MLVEQPLQAVHIALLLSKRVSLSPSSPMGPHGMTPGFVGQVTLTGCLIVEGGAGSVVRFVSQILGPVLIALVVGVAGGTNMLPVPLKRLPLLIQSRWRRICRQTQNMNKIC